MNRKAHMVFGAGSALALAACTGLCSSTPCLAVALTGGVLGSQVPDLDIRYRHRMLLHNVFSLALLVLLSYYAIAWALPSMGVLVAASLAAGYASHLFLDAATVSGVALFYPLTRRKARYARLKSSSLLANYATAAAGIGLVFLAFHCLTVHP